MIIEETKILGAYIVRQTPYADERGMFTRLFCGRELGNAGLCAGLAQVNLSVNHHKGTLRGLHTQTGEAVEDKLIACTRGEIFDVCVDVRKQSLTFGGYVGTVLSEENRTMLYIPKGCAHGYLSLSDHSQVLYFVTQFYQPEMETGYRYNDPFFGIRWPLEQPYIISEKDAKWPFLSDIEDVNKNPC
jgi:dTDP-4-dehydrorhamnose 3,5-epimerase